MHEAFAAAIIGEPHDPLHCSAYADWLDERGEHHGAFAMRWMAKHDRRPFRRQRYEGGTAVPEKYSWGWYRVSVRGTRGWTYPSWDEAVTALTEALKRVREDVSL